MKQFLLLIFLAFLTCINSSNLKGLLDELKNSNKEIINTIKICINKEGSEALKEYFNNLKNIKKLSELKITAEDKKLFEKCKKSATSTSEKIKNDIKTKLDNIKNKFKNLFKKK